MVINYKLIHSIMIEKVKIGGGQRIQNRILAELLMQGASKLAQQFDHLDHV